MRHQAVVGDPVAREVLEIVGERIGHAEQGLVHGIAGIHRIAAQVDDARVGKRGGNDPEIEEVDRRLVDPAALAVVAELRAVALAERGEIQRGRTPHQLGLAADLAGALDQGHGQIAGFATAADRRMRTEDAIDQGGAAARQADDEDWTLVAVASMLPTEETGVEGVLDQTHGFDVVFDAVTQQAAAQVGGLLQRGERARIFAEVLVFLGQRIAQGDP